MKLQLASDLHLERDPGFHLQPAAPTLVLAGDVGSYQTGSRLSERDWGLGAEAHACNLKSSTDPSGQVRSEYVAPPVLLA